VDFSEQAQEQLADIRRLGFDKLPICMAKTQDSLSDDPKKQGRPSNFCITVRQFEVANGAGFLVALTGKILRMPALPKLPAAERIQVDSEGHISGI
jgi:formate--tetrahydrofolate ligase